MKTSTRVVHLVNQVIVMVVILTVPVQAQYTIDLSRPEQYKNEAVLLINNASYVIQGVVASYKYFYGDDDKTIFTAKWIQIVKDYKGYIKQDTIVLVEKGGLIGLDNQFTEHDYGPALGLNRMYFLVLKKNVYEVNQALPELTFKKAYNLIDENDFKTYGRFSRTKADSVYLNGPYDIKFYSEEQLNTFLYETNIDDNSIKRIKRE